MEVHSEWSHIASPGVVHANTPKIRVRGRGDWTALPYRTGQYNAMELSQAPAVSSRLKTARSDSERRATGRVRTRCRLRAMSPWPPIGHGRTERIGRRPPPQDRAAPAKGAASATVPSAQWATGGQPELGRGMCGQWGGGRPRNPRIPSHPDLAGKIAGTRIFPIGPGSGMSGVIIGILPRFPIWPGNREIGKSRFGRARENSRDLRLD